MQNPENGAARLLKLLTSLNLEDEYLDSISTYGLAAELVTLIKRTGITEEMLSSWEREKQEQIIGWQPAEGSQAPAGSPDTALRAGGGEMRQSQPEPWRPGGFGTDQAWYKKKMAEKAKREQP